MRNGLPKRSLKTECGILNLDVEKGSGTHWTCWYKLDSTHCYYFDSYGLTSPSEFDDYIKMDIQVSPYNIQRDHPNICGHLCLIFLYECVIKKEPGLNTVLKLNQFFFIKMSGVNIFGEPLQLNKNLTPQRGPAGVGFRYLDAIGNFDINKKRLANVASPIEHYDAINKEYSDNYMNEIKALISDVERKQNNYIDLLNNVKIDYNDFKKSYQEEQNELNSKIGSIDEFLERIYQECIVLNTKSNELDQKVTLVRDSFERLAGEASEFVTKDHLNSIMTERTRINDLYLNNLKTELSSQTAKVNDDLSKVLNEIIDELANSTMPKASGEGERGDNVNTNNNSDRNVGSVSNRRKVNLDIDTNSGNINILQNDIQELKSEILKKNDMINSMKRELSNINKRLEDEEKIDEISEGIVENALAEEKEKGIDTVN